MRVQLRELQRLIGEFKLLNRTALGLITIILVLQRDLFACVRQAENQVLAIAQHLDVCKGDVLHHQAVIAAGTVDDHILAIAARKGVGIRTTKAIQCIIASAAIDLVSQTPTIDDIIAIGARLIHDMLGHLGIMPDGPVREFQIVDHVDQPQECSGQEDFIEENTVVSAINVQFEIVGRPITDKVDVSPANVTFKDKAVVVFAAAK